MDREIAKVYIDIEQPRFQNGAGAFGIIVTNDGLQQDVIYTGKSVLSMPVSNKIETSYQILADEYNVCFIFDDNIPKLQFYPVPQLLIFAIDSLGGCFVSTNTAMDIKEEDAPIYYIDNNLRVFYLSSNLLRFLEIVVFCPMWKEKLGLTCDSMLFAKQGQEHLIRTLNLQNNNVAFGLNEENTDNIVIYPTFDEAKKEIPFYDVENIITQLKSLTQ